MDFTSGKDDQARGQESNTSSDSLHEAHGVGADTVPCEQWRMRNFHRYNRNGRRCQTHKYMGPESCRMAAPLPLESNRRSEQGREQEADGDYFEGKPSRSVKLHEQLFHAVSPVTERNSASQDASRKIRLCDRSAWHET